MRHSILLGVALVAACAATQAASDRVALVIGNRDYAYAPLQNTINDASDMKDKLTALGFEVIYRKNADLQAMEEAVVQFGERLKGRQAGLFYYSGHGIQYEGENYLIPVDNGKSFGATTIKYKALNTGLVLDTMKAAGQPVSIVILDACRDNPFKGFRSTGYRGLANLSGPAGSLIAFATAPGDTASDGAADRNGTYTKHLLANIGAPDITVEELFKRVRRGVAEETGNRQITWENSSLRGDFCFVRCPDAVEKNRAEMDRLQEQNRLLEERLKQVESERAGLVGEMDRAGEQQARQEAEQLQRLLEQNRLLQEQIARQQAPGGAGLLVGEEEPKAVERTKGGRKQAVVLPPTF